MRLRLGGKNAELGKRKGVMSLGSAERSHNRGEGKKMPKSLIEKARADSRGKKLRIVRSGASPVTRNDHKAGKNAPSVTHGWMKVGLRVGKGRGWTNFCSPKRTSLGKRREDVCTEGSQPPAPIIPTFREKKGCSGLVARQDPEMRLEKIGLVKRGSFVG